jgi:hypothetical protein
VCWCTYNFCQSERKSLHKSFLDVLIFIHLVTPVLTLCNFSVVALLLHICIPWTNGQAGMQVKQMLDLLSPPLPPDLSVVLSSQCPCVKSSLEGTSCVILFWDDLARLTNPSVLYSSQHPSPVPFLSFNFVHFFYVRKLGGGGVAIILPENLLGPHYEMPVPNMSMNVLLAHAIICFHCILVRVSHECDRNFTCSVMEKKLVCTRTYACNNCNNFPQFPSRKLFTFGDGKIMASYWFSTRHSQVVF